MCFMFRSIDLCAGCGFSIKSDLGNPPTLLNAGKSTNFVYAVNGLTKESTEKINGIDTRQKIIDRMNSICADGGYIIVKKDGDVVAYHIYNRNSFEDYLLDNTCFERASTQKHDYAHIYENDGKMYINLNAQIRFMAERVEG